MKIWPGNSYPLGATCDNGGTNFSLFSEVAERVELCLFDEAGRKTRVGLPEVADTAGMAIFSGHRAGDPVDHPGGDAGHAHRCPDQLALRS